VKVTTKRNFFDVALDGKVVWAGSAMGPPRAEKFQILEGTALRDKVVAAAEK